MLPYVILGVFCDGRMVTEESGVKEKCSKCKWVDRNNHYAWKKVYFCLHNTAKKLCVASKAICLDVSTEKLKYSWTG